MGPGKRRAGRPKIAAAVADPEQRRELRVALKHGLVPVWDALSEEKREVILAYEELVCEQCGNLRSDCSDPSIDWHPRKSVCYASAASAWGVRKLGEKYPPEKTTDDGAHPLDGVSVQVSSIPPPEDDPSNDPAFR